ncbi:MAG: hypothetical protein K6A32_09120 [Bacteroidales bacterium]|nr:hypothetical protein [Bacteroidales bacterium]
MTQFSTIILEGGLGNRMRVAASAYAMARENALPLRVLWTSQWGMRCRFDSLFEKSTVRVGTSTEPFIRDARGLERLFFARPTVKNLHLPRLLQRLRYRHIIHSPQIWHLNQAGFDYETWFRQGHTLMTAYRDFCPWTPSDLSTLFRPTAEVQRRTDERCSGYSAYTIGVHIRRTDHQQAIDESPLSLFTDVLDREAETHGNLCIYLATDDEATKAALRQRYGTRVLMSDAEATRESTHGIRDALVEMLALSRTVHIYGSAGSTFSPIAACMGDVPITILQRDGKGTIDLLCPTKT